MRVGSLAGGFLLGLPPVKRLDWLHLGSGPRTWGWASVLHAFNLCDLFIVCFVRLVLSTILLLSPARSLGTRFRWTGSRVTEVLVAAIGVAAISALSCFLTAELWNLPAFGLETASYLLAIFSIVVMILRPDFTVVGQVSRGPSSPTSIHSSPRRIHLVCRHVGRCSVCGCRGSRPTPVGHHTWPLAQQDTCCNSRSVRPTSDTWATRRRAVTASSYVANREK